MPMWIKTRISGLLLLVFFATLSCRQNPSSANNGQNKPMAPDMEHLIYANKKSNRTEEQQINDLIHRYGWNMQPTGTGLRFQVYCSSNGQPVQRGHQVALRYQIKLLNGVEIFNSDNDGILTFTVGKAEVVSGLEEAVLLLKEKDKARIIIPSFLGHGLSGDGKKFPLKLR
jgi:FKBP-type peptidyl-prolyl cis-trans isomerase